MEVERVALEINSPAIRHAHPNINSNTNTAITNTHGNISKFKIQSVTICEVDNGGVECSFC